MVDKILKRKRNFDKTRTPLKYGGELRLSSFCSACGNRRITLVYEIGKDGNIISVVICVTDIP